MTPPSPHIDHLAVGDRLTRDQAPTCCRQDMRFYGGGSLALWECAGCRCTVYVDHDRLRGDYVVTHPPGRIAEPEQLRDPTQPHHVPARECGHDGPPSRA